MRFGGSSSSFLLSLYFAQFHTFGWSTRPAGTIRSKLSVTSSATSARKGKGRDPISLGTKPTTRKLFQSYSHCFGILVFIGGGIKAGEILLQRAKTKVLHERLACLKHIIINNNMGHRLWRKVPRMIASIDCPSLCWLGKPLNVQPYFAQLVLLFLLFGLIP